MSIQCEQCGQLNSDWATECGRCGHSFIKTEKCHPFFCALVMLAGSLTIWFGIYLLFKYFNSI